MIEPHDLRRHDDGVSFGHGRQFHIADMRASTLTKGTQSEAATEPSTRTERSLMSTLGEQHLNFWTDHLVDPSFVYVIQGDPGTPIKIGRAKDPVARMSTLQTGNPQRLHFLHVIPGGEVLESNLHGRLSFSRGYAGGGWEWFGWSDEVELLLVMIEGLARKMVKHYDGSGKPPELPDFDDRRSTQRREGLHRRIEQALLDGLSHCLIADKLDITYEEFDLELDRMRASGDYYCFFEDADQIPRGPKPKSFVKLGHRHRYGRPAVAGSGFDREINV